MYLFGGAKVVFAARENICSLSCVCFAFFCLIFSSLDSIPSFGPKHAKMFRFIVE